MVLDSKKFSINIFRKYTTLYNHNKNFRKALNNPNLIFHYRGLAIQTKWQHGVSSWRTLM